MNLPIRIPWWRIANILTLCLYAFIMLRLTEAALIQPSYNWDVFGYVATVTSWSFPGQQATFSFTIFDLRRSLPYWLFLQHIQSNLCADPKALYEQIPIYQVKPLYNVLIWLVHQGGSTLAYATGAVSALSFAALALLLSFWKPLIMPRSLWLLLVLALTCCFPMAMGSLAIFSSPDALCTFLLMATLYSWLTHRGMACFVLLALASQLARPDAIITTSALAGYFAFFAPAAWKMSKRDAIGCILFLGAVYITVYHLAHGYSMGVYFIYSFLYRMPYPAESNVKLTFQVYKDVLWPAIFMFIQNPRTAAMILWSAICCSFYFSSRRPESRMYFHLMLLAWSALAARFMVFPAWGDDRYYFVYFLIMLYAGGELVTLHGRLLYRKLTQRHMDEQTGS